MEGLDWLFDGEAGGSLAVTLSEWWTETPAGLRETAGVMTDDVDEIPIWIKGVSLIMAAPQQLQVTVGGGLYHDVGQGKW